MAKRFVKKLKDIISPIAWSIFLWSTEITQDEFVNQVYEYEKKVREFN